MNQVLGRRFISLILIAGWVIVPSSCARQGQADSSRNDVTLTAQSSGNRLNGPFLVLKVVDGDTIWVREGSRRVKVRIIGMNAPESVHPTTPVECFGPESSKFAKSKLDGHKVFLESDPSQDKYDRYGRELAYVWLSRTVLFSELAIREGYAREFTYAHRNYRWREVHQVAEDLARTSRRGLWNLCTG